MAIIFIFSTEIQNCKASPGTFCIIYGTKGKRTSLIPTTILADPKSFKDPLVLDLITPGKNIIEFFIATV